jgi:hypothetical protein
VNNLPNFIIIGAMKGGTTSLYRYLASHPEVSVSKRKETDFFLGRHEYRRGLSWYSAQFRKRTTAIGEASPNYTKRHLWDGVPERISRTLPEVKLIYVVRDPIRRILSHYVHNYAHGRERRPFSEATSPESNYVKTSMYAYQLDAFLDYFPLERILIVDSDALRNETSSLLQEVFGFVGVDPDFDVPNIDEKFHVSADKLRRPALVRHVKNRTLRRILHPLLPARLTKPQPFEPPELSPEDSNRLAESLQSDIQRFKELTGMKFDDWPV